MRKKNHFYYWKIKKYLKCPALKFRNYTPRGRVKGFPGFSGATGEPLSRWAAEHICLPPPKKQDLFFTREKASQYSFYHQSIANHFCIIYFYQMYDLYTYVYTELEERERAASTNLLIAISQVLSLESYQ